MDKEIITRERIAYDLHDLNEQALLWEGFEEAYLGHLRRCGQPTIAVYDYEKCIRILIERDGMSYEDAVEFFEFNTVGAWAGENTPGCLTALEPFEEVITEIIPKEDPRAKEATTEA
jgi:hypothetical protein